MKKYFYRIIGLGFAALATLACSREDASIETPGADDFKMTVQANAPTKTFVTEAGGNNFQISWSATDRLGVYEVANSVVQANKTTSAALGSTTTDASFTFTFSGNPTGPFDYTFVYPDEALTKSGNKYLVTIPQEQQIDANADNGYTFPPAADVMVSRPVHSNVRPNPVMASFARLGGTARMVIKAPTTSETIQKIIFSTTENVNLAGSYELNPATGELSDGITTNGTNSITLTPATSTTFTGNIVVWFRLAEITLTDNFTVSVTTDKKTYTKTMYLTQLGRELQFRNSNLTKFGIDMTDTSGVTGLDNIRTDVINAEFTGVPSTTYADWAGKKGTNTTAVYAGHSAKRASGEIGLRQQDHKGIVSTASGGTLKSVTVTIHNSTDYTRTVNIYAKSTAYSSTGDVFDDNNKGTLVQSIVYPKNTAEISETVNVPSGYSYVGISCPSYSVDIAEIQVNWEGAPEPEVTTNEASDIQYYGATLNGSFTNAAGGIYEAGFYWDTTAEALAANAHPSQVITTDGTNNTSGSFSCELNSLNELTYYYYRAYVLWLNTETNTYEEYLGEIKSFRTIAHVYSAAGWLELPAYNSATIGSDISGTTPSPLSNLYYVTHKAEMGGKQQRNYTLLYDPKMYMSYWVAYPLCSDHLGSGRDDQWGVIDPKVPENLQVPLAEGSYGVKDEEDKWYDRGHQLPNADRNGVATMQVQTYFPTNITPQRAGFNQGIWMRLEGGVRDAVHAGDTVYVVTGASYRKKGGSEDINSIHCGSRQNYMYLHVPNYYWKVLLKVKRSGSGIYDACAVGFWMEHRTDLESGGKTYANYTTTVDQIEEWTGFDFFANLPEALQNVCEDSSDWTTFKNF